MIETEQPVKARILHAALNRFLSMGFSKVTMDEVADELGISKKTMYQHFRTKDELVEAVVEWHIAIVGGRLREIMESADDFITKLYRLWKTIGDVVSRFCRQMQEDLRRHRPDLWQRIEEGRRQILSANFGLLYDEGSRLGIIKEDLNKEIVLLVYLSAVQGVINPEVLVRNSFSAADAFQTIVRVMFNGILTEPARKQFHQRIMTTIQ